MSALDFFFSSLRLEKRTGFCDIDLSKMAKAIPTLAAAIIILSEAGFKYSGDTNSNSKACTDVHKKKIFIGRDKSNSEACLSLAYELTNAKNALKFKEVQQQYLSDKSPSSEKALAYANKILSIEAEAVFHRSIVAISTGLQSQIKNKKYLEIVLSNDGDPDCINKIFSEIQQNGTVHNGKKKALEHYINQYFQYNKPLEVRKKQILLLGY
jgi:hypothetical protein